MKVDSQRVELAGVALLTSMMIADGIEVADPRRDRGVDLIAYADLGLFRAVPVQVKAVSGARFGVDRKYEKFPSLRIVHVWNVHEPSEARVFCTTFVEAVAVATELGWTETKSWERAGYSSPIDQLKPNRKMAALEPFEVRRGDWHRVLFGLERPRSEEVVSDQVSDQIFTLLRGDYEYEFLNPDGSVVHAGVTGHVVIDLEGRQLWIRQDVTSEEPAGDPALYRPHLFRALTETLDGFWASRNDGETIIVRAVTAA
ncbi:MAG: hypothetical protein ABJH68_08740 [Ilumatobacter sp.]|uniref:hypothetical protein n=1 Tax=Ilumatobacter sp. TaxID=1967498 RepID=UPI003297122E